LATKKLNAKGENKTVWVNIGESN